VILGLGLDLVAVARVARILGGPPSRAERFLVRVFTAAERAYCDAVVDRPTRYAARFAAKEATMKALGAPAGLRFLDLEVAREDGPPRLVLRGRAAEVARALGVTKLHLSITHDGGTAAAVVVAEGES
jgi:holo-[acyl-carrier protein] synthase